MSRRGDGSATGPSRSHTASGPSSRGHDVSAWSDRAGNAPGRSGTAPDLLVRASRLHAARRLPATVHTALAALAVAHLALGAYPVFSGAFQGSPTLPGWVFLLAMAAFGAGGLLMMGVVRQDERAGVLGLAFLLVAASFAVGPIAVGTGAAAGSAPPTAAPPTAGGILAGVGVALLALRVEAFLPAYLWRFVSVFPRIEEGDPYRRVPALMQTLAWCVGGLLAAAGALTQWGVGWEALAVLNRLHEGSAYWLVLSLLILPAFPVLMLRSLRAGEAERRRVRVLVAALAAGGAPILTASAAEVLGLLRDPAHIRVVSYVVVPSLFVVPLGTAYAVLVDRALGVRLIVRRALQYSLARNTLVLGAATPLAALGLFLALNQDRTLGELVLGPSAPWLVALSLGALAALQVRHRLMDRLDRAFFREQYDARRILEALVNQARSAHGPAELARLLRRRIDDALHPRHTVVFLRGPEGARLEPALGGGRSVPLAGELVRRAERTGRPFRVRRAEVTGRPGRGAGAEVTGRPGRVVGAEPTGRSLEVGRPGGWAGASPEAGPSPDEDAWAQDLGVDLLVPLRTATGELLGLVALGEKRSELPYDAEDIALLASVAAAASATLETRLPPYGGYEGHGWSRGAGGTPGGHEPAEECVSCGVIVPVGNRGCPECGASSIRRAALPRRLSGKFEIIRRLGQGGGGVVYLARDDFLGRQVALKAVGALSPEQTLVLEREARTLASITHPHLATIYGMERWGGGQVLVLEYMVGGILSDALRAGPVPWGRALTLVAAVADAVHHLHAEGLVHRDIKPGNVGFDAVGRPKLLDFGLATVSRARWEGAGTDGEEAAVEAPDPTAGAGEAAGAGAGAGAAEEVEGGWTLTGPLPGTLPYMSPEALSGRPPQPRDDVWSLGVLLAECVAGWNPFRGRTPAATVTRVVHGRSEALTAWRRGAEESAGPDAPLEALEAVLQRVLSPAADRTPTAKALRDELRVLGG